MKPQEPRKCSIGKGTDKKTNRPSVPDPQSVLESTWTHTSKAKQSVTKMQKKSLFNILC